MCAEWRTGLFTGLLHYVRNESKRSAGCGKDEVRRRHMHKKTMSLRASAATRGNPVDDVAQHIFVNPKCGGLFPLCFMEKYCKIVGQWRVAVAGCKSPESRCVRRDVKNSNHGLEGCEYIE